MASADLLAEIAAGRRLKKVPDSEKKDRSAPITGKANGSNSSVNSGPPVSTSHSNGSVPPTVGLGGLFANGMPKLRSVASSDTQNIGSKQANAGNYNKNTAPPPPPQTTSMVPPPPPVPPAATPLTNVPPPPPPIAFMPASQNSSSVPPPPPPSMQPVFHGAPPPPPPLFRPVVIRNESVGLRRAPPPTSAKPNIIPADTSLTRFISQRKMSTENQQLSLVRNSTKTIEYPTPNSNIKSNSTVSITMRLPSPAPTTLSASQPTSGGRKSSSSNRYQRAGSTSSTSNGSTSKVIYVNNPYGNQIQQQHQPLQPPSIRPTVPQTNLGTGVFVNLTHPTPPPPPPPIPSTQPLIQYDPTTLKRLAYEFEKRFNFISDDDLPPIPKLGPKNYREGSKIPTRMAPSAPMNNSSMY